MNTESGIYSFSAFRYDIVQCDCKRLGNPILHKDVNFNWNADINNRFSYWNHSRIWCVTKGSGYVKTTFGEWNLKENCAYYIPQATLLETRCDDYMVQYFVDFLPLSDFIPMENLFSFHTTSSEYEIVLTLIKKLMKTENGVMGEVKKTAIMNMLLSCFLDKPLFSVKENSDMLKVAELINSEFAHKITVAELARKFGYSADYFSHIFKKAFGVSPQRYIINKRISVAKHMLLTTEKAVSEIAANCGFDDPLYFTRLFSKEMGVAPTVFKDKFKLTKK